MLQTINAKVNWLILFFQEILLFFMKFITNYFIDQYGSLIVLAASRFLSFRRNLYLLHFTLFRQKYTGKRFLLNDKKALTAKIVRKPLRLKYWH